MEEQIDYKIEGLLRSLCQTADEIAEDAQALLDRTTEQDREVVLYDPELALKIARAGTRLEAARDALFCVTLP